MNVNDCRLMTRNEILTLVQISRSTLRSMVDVGNFPSPVRVGRRAVRWRAQDVAELYKLCAPSPGLKLSPNALIAHC